MRTLTGKRKLGYWFAYPILKTLISLVWIFSRKHIQGEEHIKALLRENKPMLPCYWHQQHLFGTWYIRHLLKRGTRIGFLVSPSVDGEVPAKLAASWGANVIRGSHTRSGAKALRELYAHIQNGLSIVNTPDGPSGPAFEFKQGAIMLAQLTGAPIVPISYTATRAWQLKTWDKFVIPKPFSRVTITVHSPVYIAKSARADEIVKLTRHISENLSAFIVN